MRSLPLLVLVALVSSWSGGLRTAHAQAVEAEAPDATALLAEGQRLYLQDADYDRALEKFEAAYQLEPSWRALGGMALMHQQQGRHLLAVAGYERLLEEFRGELTPAQIATVEARIAELMAHIAVLELSAPQPDVRVLVDGVEVGRGPLSTAIRVAPGPHTLTATRAGHEPLARRVVAVAGGRKALQLELSALPAAAVVSIVPERVETATPMRPWVPWVTIGAGAAAAGIGGALHYLSNDAYDQFDGKVQKAPGERPQPPDDSLLRRGDLERHAAIGLYAAGGVALVTGVVLLIVNRPHPVRRSADLASITVSPGGLGLAIAF